MYGITWEQKNAERVFVSSGTIWAGESRCGHTFLKSVKKSPKMLLLYFAATMEGEMRKESRLHKTVNNTVSTTIKRLSKLNPTDRFVLLEEMGEWIFCEYEELEIDYLKHKQYGGKK